MSKTKPVRVYLNGKSDTLIVPLNEEGEFGCSPEWLVQTLESFPGSRNPNYREGVVGLTLTREDLNKIFVTEENYEDR